jgi:phthiodiolone/phenolphthiodiolone dimycocerosates ketoreductase
LWDKSFTWLSEKPPSPHELFEYQTLLGALAARVGRIQLGVGVTEPIRRHPVVIAQSALTLAHLAKSPPIIGLGPGERMNTAPYGLSGAHAVERFDEALQIIRRCLSSRGLINFSGRHFRLEQAVLDLQPPPGRVPQLWIAAHGPRMLELTGRYGDGWFPASIMIASPEEYDSKLGQIRAVAGEAGRDPNAVVPALVAYIAVARTEEKAQALLNSRLLRYWGLLFPAERWRAVGLQHPFGADFRGAVDIVPEQYDRDTLDTGLAAVTPEVIRTGILVGTPEQISRRLREFGQAGLRHVVLAALSSYLSLPDAVYAGQAIRRIAHLLRT